MFSAKTLNNTCVPHHFLISRGLHVFQYQALHVERVLQDNIANLKSAISDQNLELVPDYEQRVEVLKELKFLESNSTVSLKGRVACEVGLRSVLTFPLLDFVLRSTLSMNLF